MQAKTHSPQLSNIATWLFAVLGVCLLVVLMLSFALEPRRPFAGGAAAAPTGRIAYFEFGLTADTLWLADPADLSKRQRLHTIFHAPEFGVIPAASPDGSRFAYTLLPPETPLPSHDAPAELWLASLSGSEPILLARNVDLLVEPVWTPDSSAIVYRRSNAEGSFLLTLPANGGEERILAYSSTSALFPIAFAPTGSRLFFTGLDQSGSRLLAVDVLSGVSSEIARLSNGLTRDWALSPDGRQLAYLAMSFTPADVSSRAYLLDLLSGANQPLTGAGVDAFSPVWNRDGLLVIGSLGREGDARLLNFDKGVRSQVEGPERGFEVPLSMAPSSAGYLVRSFEGSSVVSPGRSRLTLLDASGVRHTIATGEVTFVGWINP
jgi:hypothetical protein